ncbi:MAG: hypothetical protein H6Q69_1061 [Firmicutes bacterium]|nr:hypothetical protein [Bacillota bacterium]
MLPCRHILSAYFLHNNYVLTFLDCLLKTAETLTLC